MLQRNIFKQKIKKISRGPTCEVKQELYRSKNWENVITHLKT